MTTPQPPFPSQIRPARDLRRLIEVLVGCLVFGILAHAWLLAGCFVPVIVASGSMAPGLWGPHRQWRCAECQYDFSCDLESLPPPGAMALCPNCGAENDPQRGVDLPGARVWVDRSAFLWRAPRRWEAVVFASPQEPSAWCVKRVAGLPGESVRICQGDVWVDGELAKKSLACQRAMAVEVHALTDADDRWQGDPGGSWRVEGCKAEHPALSPTDRNEPSGERERIDWLGYHHRLRLKSSAPASAGPMLDESPLDQNESRALNSVHDLLLSCQLQATGPGTLYLRAAARGDQLTVRLDVETGKGELLDHLRRVAPIAAGPRPLARGARLEWMFAERRAVLALNQRVLVQYDCGEAPAAANAPPPTIAIGARRAGIEIHDLRLARDAHYTASPGESREYRLGTNEYFLLGDNSPRAIDSRFWTPGGGLSGTLLVGKALSW